MTPEQRLDRAERILVTMAKSGRRTRSEWRYKINSLVDAQLRNEAECHALDEKINILLDAQIKTTEHINKTSEQIDKMSVHVEETSKQIREAQKSTDKTLRAFIDSLRKGGNGNSSYS